MVQERDMKNSSGGGKVSSFSIAAEVTKRAPSRTSPRHKHTMGKAPRCGNSAVQTIRPNDISVEILTRTKEIEGRIRTMNETNQVENLSFFIEGTKEIASICQKLLHNIALHGMMDPSKNDKLRPKKAVDSTCILPLVHILDSLDGKPAGKKSGYTEKLRDIAQSLCNSLLFFTFNIIKSQETSPKAGKNIPEVSVFYHNLKMLLIDNKILSSAKVNVHISHLISFAEFCLTIDEFDSAFITCSIMAEKRNEMMPNVAQRIRFYGCLLQLAKWYCTGGDNTVNAMDCCDEVLSSIVWKKISIERTHNVLAVSARVIHIQALWTLTTIQEREKKWLASRATSREALKRIHEMYLAGYHEPRLVYYSARIKYQMVRNMVHTRPEQHKVEVIHLLKEIMETLHGQATTDGINTDWQQNEREFMLLDCYALLAYVYGESGTSDSELVEAKQARLAFFHLQKKLIEAGIQCINATHANIFTGCESGTCSICLCDISSEDHDSHLLLCHHLLHQKCVGRWHTNQRNCGKSMSCPLCRYQLRWSSE